MDTNNRIKWVDIAKGIGIILVIAGHTFALDYCRPIYTFHMPLFFFLSGLFLKTDMPFKQFLQKKTKAILGVWVLVIIISLLICLCVPEWRNMISAKSLLSDFYSVNTNVIQNSSLWYLVCLFFAENMFYLLEKIRTIMSQKLFFILFIIYALTLLMLPNILTIASNFIPLHGNRLPFKIDTALYAVVFISIGKWIKPYIGQLLERCTFIYTIMLFLIWFVLAYFNGVTNLNSLAFGQYRLLFYPIALLGIAWVCGVSREVSTKPNSIIHKIITFYGENSLVIFIFQSLFIRLYLLIANKIFGLEMILYMNNPIEHQIGAFIVVGFIISPIMVLLYKRVKVAIS